jgi:hypothetical protein
MTSNRLQLAIARHSRIRRSRDIGWMIFAAAACAALFGFAAAFSIVLAPPIAWLPLLLFGVFAVAMAAAAWRLFGAARALNGRLKAAENLSALPEGPEPSVSVWSEMFPQRRGD